MYGMGKMEHSDVSTMLRAFDDEPTRAQVDALQELVLTMPQLEQPVVEHYFADGMYLRKVFSRAGGLIIGKVHKKEHFYMIVSGSVMVGRKVYFAGDVIVSKVGTKRVVIVLEDAIRMTVHRTEERDLDAIEKELIEEDSCALYDAAGKLKELT